MVQIMVLGDGLLRRGLLSDPTSDPTSILKVKPDRSQGGKKEDAEKLLGPDSPQSRWLHGPTSVFQNF